jgi:hypothetical protein
MTRQDVYDLIDSEREYQDREWPGSKALPVPGEILLMEDYLRQLKKDYQSDYDAPNESAPLAVLQTLRKIVTIGIRALENVHLDKRELMRSTCRD